MNNTITIELDIAEAEIMLEKAIAAVEFMDSYAEINTANLRTADANAMRGISTVVANGIGLSPDELEWQNDPMLAQMSGESLWKNTKSVASKVYRGVAAAMIAARRAITAFIKAILAKFGIGTKDEIKPGKTEEVVTEHVAAVKQVGAQVGEKLSEEQVVAAEEISQDIFLDKKGVVATEHQLRTNAYTLTGKKRIANDVSLCLSELCTERDATNIAETLDRYCTNLERFISCYALAELPTIIGFVKNISSPEDVKKISEQCPKLIDDLREHFIRSGKLADVKGAMQSGVKQQGVEIGKGVYIGVVDRRNFGFKTGTFGRVAKKDTIVGLPKVGTATLDVLDEYLARLQSIGEKINLINDEVTKIEEELTSNNGRPMASAKEAIDFHLPAGSLDDARRKKALEVCDFLFGDGIKGLYTITTVGAGIVRAHSTNINVVRSDISKVISRAKARGDKNKK